MGYNISQTRLLLARYKGPILLLSLCFVVSVILGLGTLGFIVYRSGVFVKDKVSFLQDKPFERVSFEAPSHGGIVEGLVMNVASHWVHQNLPISETPHFRAGLACFDALGGPNPKTMIDHVKTRISDQKVLARLNELRNTFEQGIPHDEGTGSCASWILNAQKIF